MANARIVLGGEIDVCTTDEMHSGMKGLGKEIVGGLAHQKPIMRPLSQSVNIGNMNQFDARILTVGSPAAGRIWKVTRITVLGNGDTSVLTNVSGALYIGDDQNAALMQCVQHGQQIPFTTIENEQAFVVHSRENLFVNIFASAAATAVQVTVNALAWEYPDSAVSTQVI